MPRGFLRSTSAEVGGSIIVVRIAVQRLVPASDPRSYAVSVHFTWNELGEARTTLVICTDTVRSPTLANGDRKSVVEGTSVSVRVDLGGRRIIKKKTTENNTRL